MHTSAFFRLFPPPKFLAMKHSGLDVSDDAIYCLEYSGSSAYHGGKNTISKFSKNEILENIIQGGDIKDEKKFIDLLRSIGKKNGLSYVKVSVPEEKAYLFQTDISGSTINEIRQNIEFKLEENVPLAAPDAVFYYDLMPLSVTAGSLKASVSVVPRTYIEKFMELISQAELFPVAFEVVPKAVARAVVPPDLDKTVIVLHVMNFKTGIYVVSGGVVCFTSTISWGSRTPEEVGKPTYVELLSKEVNRVYSYWESREGNSSLVSQVLLIGSGSATYEMPLNGCIQGASVPVTVANAWQNTLDLNKYLPPISKDDSLEYIVAAGLALDS